MQIYNKIYMYGLQPHNKIQSVLITRIGAAGVFGIEPPASASYPLQEEKDGISKE